MVTTSCDAAPKTTLNVFETLDVNPPSVAVTEYAVPTVEIRHDEKLTTPAVSICVHPDNVPGPPLDGVPAVIARVTVELFDVTMFPPASCIWTTGCVVNGLPPKAPAGDVTIDIFAAAPTVMLKLIVTALVRAPSVAVSA